MTAARSSSTMERRRPAKEDVCPLDSKLMRKDSTRPATPRGSPAQLGQGEDQPVSDWGGPLEERLSSDDELGRLDIDLDRKSRQHNLTSNNVRTILHEVITHEKVVAMMKAAIMDTKDLPLFEPKMTRSRLKQVVQQEQAHTWSLSLSNPLKPPQFVDINLEEDEDSSDEEYCPDEEEEDTAEETILSDADSLASPLRTHVGSQTNPRNPNAENPKQSLQSFSGDLRGQEETCTDAALQLVCGPAERSFLEKLGAVDEELACGPTYTYDQSIDRKHVDEDGVDEGSSCLAYRTRSKLPLVNIPLDQLEAELLAPDITADMYDQSSAHRDEDCHWTNWLQSLMAPDCEDEAEDEDDPEYNFLDEPDEPDLEDYRTDRAVQITKKEVNELLEELFDALREEDATAEDEEAPSEILPKFNIPQALRFEAPLASMLTERRQTVRRQYEALQQRRVLQDTTNHPDNSTTQRDTTPPILVLPGLCSTLRLTPVQKLQLQQQMQQHVQLLTQVHLLSRRVSALNLQAVLSKQYLEELQNFACQREELCLPSSFRACNLQGALHLLQEVEQREESPPAPLACAAAKRLLPHMTPATCSHAFPLLPADVAWLFATRPVFLHPELLPVCSLDPALHNRPHRSVYTAGEDRLIVLGLKHFEGAVQADQLMTSYLLCKSRWNVRKHIREMSGSRALQGNVIQTFVKQGTLPQMTPVCSRVEPGDQRPPVDRNTSSMPNWLQLEEQQAFERSRRFLRQLEISFGDNPSLYQKIIKALQTGPDLSSAGIQELKAQMSSLLKGHTHLQAEFWVFFDELRPPPARPGQFEEAHWLQDGDTGEALSLLSGGGASGGFEEVTLPELADEDEGLKIQSMKSRCQRRKMESHRSYKGSVGVSRAAKSLNNLYAHINPAHCEPGEGNQERKEIEDNIQPDQSDASWDDTRHPTDEKEEGSDDKDEEHNIFREKKTEESLPSCSSSYEPSFSAPPDPPVCAKNISLTASGEKVVLWTREADRVILTMCQREGANQSSFQAISSLLGNKTANEVRASLSASNPDFLYWVVTCSLLQVSGRFQDLVRLFRTAARHCTSEDVAPPIEPLTQSE
uniref:Uncharacterized protein n=1 Tax=Oryzias latipes TaxID=8090 RepID=A0A3P9M089_ORYLA